MISMLWDFDLFSRGENFVEIYIPSFRLIDYYFFKLEEAVSLFSQIIQGVEGRIHDGMS